MEPRQLLADALDTQATDQGVDVNIYAEPPAILATPALVIRPDSPWRRPGTGQPFPYIEERYAIVAAVQAGPDAVDQLRELALLIESIQNTSDSWRWTETTGIVQVDLGGITHLGATSRVSYLEG